MSPTADSFVVRPDPKHTPIATRSNAISSHRVKVESRMMDITELIVYEIKVKDWVGPRKTLVNDNQQSYMHGCCIYNLMAV